MSAGQGVPEQPTPSMMPRRRASIPSAPPRPVPRATFKTAPNIPRRGWAEAVVWPDTGVLLGLGTSDGLPAIFRAHFANRIRVANGVVREIRAQSEKKPPADATDAEIAKMLAKMQAASHVYGMLLRADIALPTVTLEMDDLKEVAAVTERLKALSGETGKKHGGEAEIIVLAAKAAARDGRQHVILTNDGGASVVADAYGLPSRHIGHTLTEFACSDENLRSSDCYSWFMTSMVVSSPPVHSRQTSEAGFACQTTFNGCAACDHLDSQ